MRLATTTADFRSFYGNDHITLIRQLYDAGFRYIDLSLSRVDREDPLLVREDWRKEAGRLKSFVESMGMAFVQAHSPCWASYDDSLRARTALGAIKDYDLNLKWQIRAIQVCKELGIPNIVVHPLISEHTGKDAFYELNRKFYRELIPVMEETGVNVLTENAAGEDLQSKEDIRDKFMATTGAQLKELVKYVDHPQFHVCWDIAHRSQDGCNQYEDLMALGEDLYGLHVGDNRGPKHGHTHIIPFFGVVNFDDIMHGLIDCGYKGDFTYEVCGTIPPAEARRKFDEDDRLSRCPLELEKDLERYKYKVGKYILEKYGCFEG